VSTATRRAVYGKLAGDVTLGTLLADAAPGYAHGIYYQSAPDNAAFPLIIFSKQSGIPTEAMSDPTALDTEVWLVKAVDHNSTADRAEAIAERARALLNDGALSIAGGQGLYLRRSSDIDYSELAAGETYLHSGSLYRLVTEPT
jgi:hypothetical protein